jgi:hypothetical protein
MKNKKLSIEEANLLKTILEKVYESMKEEEEDFFTDGGRFILSLNTSEMQILKSLTEKI